ncbi:DUF317 domain-containing protein [Streptomyces rubradiris]|uniref:DUF317 domain-containing protein n=1 Tax=Streptomyces rubradiris TaxID=285531 RepID=A0ABQ3RDJ7_STRRR|nr:DUF317 domain-containing protein [Streptomyces rubradiris]GHH29653.1 hypothetical protein GCM10018792_75060 [Streptomyces rubradiris]GHI53933.1 hypothetical protein Srubr_37790 [Streptomyces rubradiris]
MPPDNDLSASGDVYVSPRYLAGLPGHPDPSFDPVAHWPHHYPETGPCQLVVASPDHRIRVGWFGDDYDTWVISAAADPISPPRWTARINHVTPPEIVAGLTRALAEEWAENSYTFLTQPSVYWTDGMHPLLDAGWKRNPPCHGVVDIVAPDGLAGASIDVAAPDPDAETVTLWAGPPGWATRAEAVFTARTPSHLIAATAAALADPNPVIRSRTTLHPRLAELAQLTSVEPPKPAVPTPLDVHRAAAARRPTVLPAPSARRWTTSTPPPPARPAARPGLRR